jgi:hypothetical protein
MAAVTIGTSNLTFGITAETGGLVQSFSEVRNVQKQEVRNNVGEVTGVAFFNATTAYSLSLTTTTAFTSTSAGGAISIANATTSVGSTRIDSLTISKSNDGFVTVDISATGYPNVT